MRQGKISKKLHHVIAACEFVRPLGIFYWLTGLMINSANVLSIHSKGKQGLLQMTFPSDRVLLLKMNVKINIYRNQNNLHMVNNWNKYYRVTGSS